MGLFDKQNTDGTGSTGLFLQEVVTFAKLDLNGFFKMAIPAAVSFITNAISFFGDVFGQKDCNYQDSTLVERFIDQIPGMWLLMVDLGYEDESIREPLEEGKILEVMQFGRPRGAHPCNELIYPARLLMTVLFGVRITNDQYLDALDSGVDAYYASGPNTWDIPRSAVERAVMLKQKYFPISTYNTKQWDLNKFQQFPLVAPVPDPIEPGKLFTGEFLGLKILNGKVIGTPIPDIEGYTKALESGKPYIAPGATGTDTGSMIDKIISFVKTDPLKAVVVAAAVLYAVYEIEENKL